MTAIAEQPPRSPRPKKWTQQEYLDLVERGAFQNQRVYLFRGDIIEMAPHGHPHAFGITKLNRYLTRVFAEPFEVRIQLSFITPGDSVPEPDGAVCTAEDALRKPHPSHAQLVAEVADSSLSADRAKAEEYAAALVPEYWIIDVDHRRVEIYRRPVQDPSAAYGYRYADARVFSGGEQVVPMDRPDATIAVSSFFD